MADTHIEIDERDEFHELSKREMEDVTGGDGGRDGGTFSFSFQVGDTIFYQRDRVLKLSPQNA